MYRLTMYLGKWRGRAGLGYAERGQAMDSRAIVVTFVVACGLAVAALVAHRRLAGTGERAGCVSMIAFVVAWLAVLTALITGAFLLGARGA